MPSDFKSNIRKMCIFEFFISLHFIGGVLIPFFTDWGGITFTQILLLQSWFMFWSFVLEVPTGTIADYFGRKHSLILAAIVNIFGAFLYGSIPNFYSFLVAEFLWATATSLKSGADGALVYDTLKKIKKTKQSKKIYARLKSFHLIGIMIGAPIGSIIASRFGLNMPMFLLVIPFTIATIVSLTLKEPKIAKKIESKRYINTLKEGVKFFYKSEILRILAFDMIFISSIAYFMIWFYQPMLENAGIDIAYFGIVHALLVLSQLIIVNNYERLENILGSKKRLIFLSSLILGLMFILGGLTTLTPLVLMVIIIGGGFGLSRVPLFQSYMNKYIPSSERATILSTISMFRRFALVIVNPIVGFLVDWSFNYTLIILGVTAVIFSFISKIEEDHLLD